MKIIDKVNAEIAKGHKFFSFEYFPPRTEEVRRSSPYGNQNLCLNNMDW